MTDRELLEMAAKAAGLRYNWYAHGVGPMIIVSDLPDNSGRMPQRTRWNPLSDDGDALRLAVMLGIAPIQHKEYNVCSAYWTDIDCCSVGYKSDPYAATRRAIVRAAAEIGKNVKEGE